MSIFTETFQNFVFNQLKIREAAINQKSGRALGRPKVKGLRGEDAEETSVDLPAGAFYTNTVSRQCIIRMSSGVDLKQENDLLDENDIGKENLVGEGLAIRYMLESGVPSKDVDFLNNRKEGKSEIKVIPRGKETRQFTRGSGKDYGSVYGDPYIRSDAKDDFGIVPMPGIINAEIRTKTAYGSLRDAKINFVCHNRRQLDVLDALYMRPGMPVLLEWGWSVYIDNKGKKENYFPYLWEWFDSNQNINNINQIIHQRIEKAGGNYDGFVGYVKNFEITSRPDGGYDCSVDLAAMGEVVEGITGRNDGLTIPTSGDGNLLEEKEVDNLEYYLYALYEYCETIKGEKTAANASDNVGKYAMNIGEERDENENYNTRLKYLRSIQSDVLPLVGIENKHDLGPDRKLNKSETNVEGDPRKGEGYYGQDFQKTFTSGNNGTEEAGFDKFLIYKNEKLGVEGDELDNTKSSHHYVRWDLLCIILNGLVFNSYQPSKDSKPTPMTKLTWTKELPVGGWGKTYLKYSKFNFIQKTAEFRRTQGKIVKADLSYLLDMSVNPKICLLPHQLKSLTPDKDSATDKTMNVDNTKDSKDSDRSIGHIFIGLEYLIGLFQRLRYKGEEVIEDFNILTYLQTIWEKDINNACGGTHNFIVSSEKSNGDTFRIIDTTKGPEPNLTPTNLYEFNIQGNTSIVRDFNYNTTIDSKLSSTVAIAAQSPTDISSLDAVSFAAFNRNIQNRFFKEPNEGEDRKTQKIKLEEYDRDVEKVKKMLGYLYDYRIEMLQGTQGSMITALSFVKNLESKIISLKSRYSETINNLKIYKGYPRKSTNISKSTIIPLKFNCQIDGIGGLIIGNVFKVKKEFLPKGYQEDDIAFAITTENQTITSGQDWTTEFSGQVLLLDLNRDKHEDIQLLKLDIQTTPTVQTGATSANKNSIISVEQSTLDPAMNDASDGDDVYLKINNEPTNVRTGTEVDSGLLDNIIGNIELGNKGLLLGTIVERNFKNKVPKWIARSAGDPITEAQKKVLKHKYVLQTYKEGSKSYETYPYGKIMEKIATDSSIYDGARSGGGGSVESQQGLDYFNTRWNRTPRKDGYYFLTVGAAKENYKGYKSDGSISPDTYDLRETVIGQNKIPADKYAFEQMIEERWFLIEFNEDAKKKIIMQGGMNGDDFIGPNKNQGWMRLDVLQYSSVF